MEVPKFLLRKKYLFESVLFIVLFSILFLTLYRPFSATAWFGFRPLSRLLTTLSFYVVALVLMAIGKYLLYRFHAGRPFSVGGYLGWIAAEFLTIALLYILFTIAFGLRDSALTFGFYLRVFCCVALILAIPYTIITLYAGYRGKNEELNLMKLNGALAAESEGSRLVHFNDNNGVLKMSVDADTLYYIESQDNYVRIYYELDGRLLSYMLRCKTQRIEESLAGTPLIRCHRSYIVNTHKIKFYKNNHDRATIVLTHADAKQIPVSKSYYKAVTEVVSASASGVAAAVAGASGASAVSGDSVTSMGAPGAAAAGPAAGFAPVSGFAAAPGFGAPAGGTGAAAEPETK